MGRVRVEELPKGKGGTECNRQTDRQYRGHVIPWVRSIDREPIPHPAAGHGCKSQAQDQARRRGHGISPEDEPRRLGMFCSERQANPRLVKAPCDGVLRQAEYSTADCEKRKCGKDEEYKGRRGVLSKRLKDDRVHRLVPGEHK